MEGGGMASKRSRSESPMARTAAAVPHVQPALLLRGCPEVQQGAVQVEAEQSALLLRAAEAITALQDYARRVDTLKDF